jgi:hypothetical protein
LKGTNFGRGIEDGTADETSEGSADEIEDGIADGTSEGTCNRKRNPFFFNDLNNSLTIFNLIDMREAQRIHRRI